jgi:hypothetical protein
MMIIIMICIKYKVEETNEKISFDIPNRIEGRGSC